ncbi:hypothetical protein [Isoptericola sp. NPDC057653]|uniref:hypothetical protein n=1 Tax=Isoptericola sp. NPDC057653 TaxID=3346195 RepID=UPI003681BF64
MTDDHRAPYARAAGPRRRHRPAAVAAACAALAAAGVVAAPSAVAEPECLGPSHDLDGDRVPDAVVGAPGGTGRPGTVEVRLTGDGEPRTVVLRGPVGFGTAVAQLRSYEQEGDDRFCSQLVVGSPEETVFGMPHAGAVYLYAYDSSVGAFVLRERITADSESVLGTPQAGARFGAALASASYPEETIDPKPQLLWVGSPGHDAANAPDSGRVTSFVVGATDTTTRGGEVFDLADLGVRGSAAAGAALGSSLSVRGQVMAAGAPGMRVAGKAGAGGVALWFAPPGDPGGLPPEPGTQHPPVLVHQALARVPGEAEAGDRFGAAVHLFPVAGDPQVVDLAVGSPGEDLGPDVDAGMVSVGRVHPGLTQPLLTFRSRHQDSPGEAGTAEDGDLFGSAVSVAFLRGAWRVVVGSPGEDVGSVRDAGMVQALGTGQGWTQDSPAVPGGAEAGDRMGATVGADPEVVPGRAPDVGVPGENAATGAVLTGLLAEGSVVRLDLGAAPGARYGRAIAP